MPVPVRSSTMSNKNHTDRPGKRSTPVDGPRVSSEALDILTRFHWEPQPKAQALVNELVAQFLARCPEAAVFADRLKSETGTRFADWIDHIQVPYSGKVRDRLIGVGFTHHPLPGAPH